VGKADLPPDSSVQSVIGVGGVTYVKIFAEAPEVSIIVEAAGYATQVGRFVAGAPPLRSA